MKAFFDHYFNKIEESLYTPCLGVVGSKIIVYNEYIHIHAKLFFEVLKKYNLEFYVFAGTSIGYVRNKSNIPWVDDYDVIIFEKDIDLFEKKIVPYLNNFGFDCFPPDKFNIKQAGGGYHILSKKNIYNQNDKPNFFQCDVFYSKVIENNIVKNLSGWGLYDKKNITYDIIYPPKILKIDDLVLPFFNRIEDDVEIEYGDVINNCCVHLNHKEIKCIQENFNIVYEFFNNILKKCEQNTLEFISKNKNFNYEKKCIFDEKINFNSIFDALKFINLNNVKEIFIMDEKYLKYCLSIKYFFPKIKIIFYLFSEIQNFNLIFLNYVDIIKCKNENLKNKYENDNIVYVKSKPIFEMITVITFGTYDLFHVGHYNILKRAKELGSKLIVGVSSDELNMKKGKVSINKIQKRIIDVYESKFVDLCFIEESLEDKDKYINEYKADILVMGDDWKDKFDWVSCPCVYLPRTPGISTTLLKEIKSS